MQYQFQTYFFTIWNEIRKGNRIGNIRRIVQQMKEDLNRRKDLLSKIAIYVTPEADQYQISLGLSTLKLNNDWLFKGIRTGFKRGWMLKLKKLKKINKKNQILVLENFLLLGKDILKSSDLKTLDNMGLVLHINAIDANILERYFLDKKRKIRRHMQNFSLTSSGPFLLQTIRLNKARARNFWRKYFFNKSIKEELNPAQVNKEIKLALMTAAYKEKIPGILTQKDYLMNEKDPLLQYLFFAMIYNDPKRKKNIVQNERKEQFELLKDIKNKAAV